MGYLFTIMAATIWGLTYALRPKTATFIPPLAMSFISGIVYTIVAGSILAMKGQISTVVADSKSLGIAVFSSVIALLGSWLIYSAIDKLNPTSVVMVEISYPLFTALFCWILYRQTLSWPVVVGGLLIFSGSVVIMVFGKPLS